MKRISLSVFVLCLLVPVALADTPAWKALPVALSGEIINRIVWDPDAKDRIHLLSTNGLLISSLRESGRTVVPDRLLKGHVHDLLIREGGRGILAATSDGLEFRASPQKTWQRLLQGEVRTILEDRGRIYVGSQKGLYVFEDLTRHALRMPGETGRHPVRILRRHPQGVLAVTPDRVYLIRPGEEIPEMILKVSSGDEIDEAQSEEDQDEETGAPLIRALEVLDGVIYVVSSEGILKGAGPDIRWENISSEGLIQEEISSLALVPDAEGEPLVCVAGGRGIQCRLEGAWVSVDRGLGGQRIVALQRTTEGDLIACGEGVFVLHAAGERTLMALGNIFSGDSCQFDDYARLKEGFHHEPSLQEVHKMLIYYSDTSKSKIDAWHRQSRIKAFVPSFSVGANRSATDLFHWDTGPNPDVLQKGREYVDWDVSLSWELGDVIWSSSQTSIDSRSKMMVELREKLLDQVTRLYFERRRMQIELSACSYPSAGERMAAEMRVEELTGYLDAYTGGEFSKKIKHRTNV